NVQPHPPLELRQHPPSPRTRAAAASTPLAAATTTPAPSRPRRSRLPKGWGGGWGEGAAAAEGVAQLAAGVFGGAAGVAAAVGQGGRGPDGLGPESDEEQPRENGSLDLEGRECLACSISSPPPGGKKGGGGGGGGGGRVAAALAAAAAAGRRGRSELYLVLDAKAFLLATPDRHRLMNGEIKSAAPLLHLAAAVDPSDEKRLHIRALSHRPVALMRPVTPLGHSTSKPSPPLGGGGSVRFRGGGGAGGRGGSGVIAEGGGDAGSMCDMQVWACELSFENARSCRLARKHMEGRRLRLRSEKTKRISELLEACVQGRED
ncbi:unnamed protein product, partial [Laminaria digitata]